MLGSRDDDEPDVAHAPGSLRSSGLQHAFGSVARRPGVRHGAGFATISFASFDSGECAGSATQVDGGHCSPRWKETVRAPSSR